MIDLRDRVALVTGGSSGIGLATARLLAARGARVWLVARNPERLCEALASVQRDDGQMVKGGCGTVAADVADPEQAAMAVAEVTAQAGAPDILINSAGITYPGYFQEIDIARFHEIMDINYFGTLHMVKAVIPAMIARGTGHIVNISSLAGLIGVYGYTAYGASKFAVRGFTDTLRAEMRPHGIDVSIVYPPDTDTPQLAYEEPFKPREMRELSGNAHVMRPETVAEDILRGMERRQYVILPGFEGKLIYWLSGMVGSGIYPIMDLMIARAHHHKKG